MTKEEIEFYNKGMEALIVLATQQRLCGDAPPRKRAAPERELAAAN